MSIVLGVLVAFIFVFFILLWCWNELRKKNSKLEEENRSLRSRLAFLEEKKKIKEEVFGNAEKVNEKINSSNNSERFDAACSVLCKQKKQ